MCRNLIKTRPGATFQAFQHARGTVNTLPGGAAPKRRDSSTKVATCVVPARATGIPAHFHRSGRARIGLGQPRDQTAQGRRPHNLSGIRPGGMDWNSTRPSTTNHLPVLSKRSSISFASIRPMPKPSRLRTLLKGNPRYAGVLRVGPGRQAFAQALQKSRVMRLIPPRPSSSRASSQAVFPSGLSGCSQALQLAIRRRVRRYVKVSF